MTRQKQLQQKFRTSKQWKWKFMNNTKIVGPVAENTHKIIKYLQFSANLPPIVTQGLQILI